MSRLGLAALLLLSALAVRAGQDDDAGGADLRKLLRQGSVELQAGVGLGSAVGHDYSLLSLGGGYYVADGLSVGGEGGAWLGAQPVIGDVSPQIRYVFVDSPARFKPYLGTFYRRTFFSRWYVPMDSLGARAGLVFPVGARSYLAGGLVFEHYFDCAADGFSSCDQAYPEVLFVFGL